MGTLVYFIKEAVRGFYQAKLMTFVSIVSIAASLCLMALLIVAFLNIELHMRRGTDQADIAVYLKDKSADDSKAVGAAVTDRILTSGLVRQVVWVDKDSAWQRISGYYGEELLDAIDDNPLPASLEIFLDEDARSQERVAELTHRFEEYPEVESVRYSHEWIDLVERFRLYFWVGATTLAVIMLFILYFMISNTIKLTIYARRELVQHMQVVGATALFIKMPFILEGILQGVIGGMLCSMALGIVRVSLMHFSIYWGPQSLPLFIIFLGVIFGWMGSMGAVRKFLV